MNLQTLLFVVALGGVLVPTSPISAFDAEADIQDLIATDKRMQRAFVDRDVTALKNILTDDYILVVPDGREFTKTDVIGDVETGVTTWHFNETRDWHVRVHGDVGVVIATLHTGGIDHGKPFDRLVKFSDTYIRDQGLWRNVHAHTCISTHLNGK